MPGFNASGSQLGNSSVKAAGAPSKSSIPIAVVQTRVYGPGIYTYTALANGNYTIRIWGGGAGCSYNTSTGYVNGGGSGAFVSKLVTLQAGQVINLNVGLAGIGSASASTNGSTTTATVNGLVLSAGGGFFGINTSAVGGLGGIASGGDINLNGTAGIGGSYTVSVGGSAPGDALYSGGTSGIAGSGFINCFGNTPGGGGSGQNANSQGIPGGNGQAVITFEGQPQPAALTTGPQVGDIRQFTGTVPSNWVRTDGSIVSQGAYPQLTSVLGTCLGTPTIQAISGGSAISAQVSAPVYGNGKYIAINSALTGSLVSNDGMTWTAGGTINTSYRYGNLTFGAGLFVVSGTGSASTAATTSVYTSPDGITWTARTLASNTISRGLAYVNGLFVFLGTGIYTSSDAITWTNRASGNWFRCTYGNGRYVVSGNNVGCYSLDGITWTNTTILATGGAYYGLAFGNGVFVTAAYNNNSVLKSTDGINWSTVGFPFPSSTSYVGTIDSNGVVFYNGYFYLITNDPQLFVSSDLVNWSALTSVGNISAGAFGFANNQFMQFTVAAASMYTGSLNSVQLPNRGNSYICASLPSLTPALPSTTPATLPYATGDIVRFTSNPGGNWLPANGQVVQGSAYPNLTQFYGQGPSLTQRNNTLAYNLNSAATNGSIIVAFNLAQNNYEYSIDGVTWTAGNSGNSPFGYVAYGNGYFVVGPGQNNQLVYSTDGINWSTYSMGGNNSVAYANGFFWMSNGYKFTTPTAPTATAASGLSGVFGYSIAYGNSTYVGTHVTSGSYLVSTNGTSFTAGTGTGVGVATYVCFGFGSFYMSGSTGLAKSTNGTSWSLINSLNTTSVVFNASLNAIIATTTNSILISYDGINFSTYSAGVTGLQVSCQFGANTYFFGNTQTNGYPYIGYATYNLIQLPNAGANYYVATAPSTSTAVPGTGTLIQDTGYLPVGTTSWTVPNRATWVDVICVSGGGGSINSGSYGCSGGGSAIARSAFAVIPGQTISMIVGAAGSSTGTTFPVPNGTTSTVTYNGTLMCSADSGKGPVSSTVGGLGGQATSCVYNIEAFTASSGRTSASSSDFAPGGTASVDSFGVSRINQTIPNANNAVTTAGQSAANSGLSTVNVGPGVGGSSINNGFSYVASNGTVILRFTSY